MNNLIEVQDKMRSIESLITNCETKLNEKKLGINNELIAVIITCLIMVIFAVTKVFSNNVINILSFWLSLAIITILWVETLKRKRIRKIKNKIRIAKQLKLNLEKHFEELYN